MDPRDLILSRTLACTPEAAFRCWTEPDLRRRFFAPRPGLTTQAEIDLHPGLRSPVEGGDHIAILESVGLQLNQSG